MSSEKDKKIGKLALIAAAAGGGMLLLTYFLKGKLNLKIAISPSVYDPTTSSSITVAGSGFTPNSTAEINSWVYISSPFMPITVSTDANGNVSAQYATPITASVGGSPLLPLYFSITDTKTGQVSSPTYAAVSTSVPFTPILTEASHSGLTESVFVDNSNNTNVTSVVVAWGDGQSTTITAAQNPDVNAQIIQVGPHTYSAGGTYKITATDYFSSGDSAFTNLQVTMTSPTMPSLSSASYNPTTSVFNIVGQNFTPNGAVTVVLSVGTNMQDVYKFWSTTAASNGSINYTSIIALVNGNVYSFWCRDVTTSTDSNSLPIFG